jgi:hypothetical protein
MVVIYSHRKGIKMSEMVAICGLLCNECGAFIATSKNSKEERAKVAELWSQQYKQNIKPEDINCEGCIPDGRRLFRHSKDCKIRKCGKERAVRNCAYCDEYACEKLGEFFKKAPDAGRRLNEIRSKLKQGDHSSA